MTKKHHRLPVVLLSLLLCVPIASAGWSLLHKTATPQSLLTNPASAFDAIGEIPAVRKTATHLLVLCGRRQIGNVCIGASRLLEIPETPNEQASANAADAIDRLAASGDTPVTAAILPDAAALYDTEVSSLLFLPDEKTAYASLLSQIGNAATVNLLSTLNEVRDEDIFYNTDSSWTSLGAYYGYTAIARAMGLSVIQKEKFTIRYMDSEALGRLYETAQYGKSYADSVEFYSLSAADSSVMVTVTDGDDSRKYNTFYRTEYIGSSEFVYSFLGGEVDRIDISTGSEGGRLLLIGDENAHVAAQFLCCHFSEITLLPTTALLSSIDTSDYAQVLVLADFSEMQTVFQNANF